MSTVTANSARRYPRSLRRELAKAVTMRPMPTLSSKADIDMDGQGSEFVEEDRRRSKRYRIYAPAIARLRERDISVFTRDVSTLGAYLNAAGTERLPEVGESVELIITVPPTINSVKSCCIIGRGIITRIERRPYGETGIAVEMADFAIQGESHSSPDNDVLA
jgi:hypothetical protein